MADMPTLGAECSGHIHTASLRCCTGALRTTSSSPQTGETAYQRGYKLRVYRRNKNGALTLLPQPFGILGGPVDEIAVMHDGRHVYAQRPTCS